MTTSETPPIRSSASMASEAYRSPAGHYDRRTGQVGAAGQHAQRRAQQLLEEIDHGGHARHVGTRQRGAQHEARTKRHHHERILRRNAGVSAHKSD